MYVCTCVHATSLLFLQYILCILIVFVLELSAGILGFIFQNDVVSHS